MSFIKSLSVILLASVGCGFGIYPSHAADQLDGLKDKKSGGRPLSLQQQEQKKGKDSKKKKVKSGGNAVSQTGSLREEEPNLGTDGGEVLLQAPKEKDERKEQQTLTSLSVSVDEVVEDEKKEKVDQTTTISRSSSGELIDAALPEDHDLEKDKAAKTATPKPYQGLMDEALEMLGAYVDIRAAAALKDFPFKVQINPFTEAPNAEFNDLYTLLASNFYDYGKNEDALKARQESVYDWFYSKLQVKEEQRKKLEEDLKDHKDGILKGVKVTVDGLSAVIAAYKLRLAESLDDMNQIDGFIRFTENAISTTETTIKYYEGMRDNEPNLDEKSKHEKKIIDFKSNVLKYREQIIIVEALMHAKYPFHRTRSYLMGLIPFPDLTQKWSRYGVTGVSVLSSSLTVPALKLNDTISDDGGHFKALMKRMLSSTDQTLTLNDAITNKRVIFLKEE